MTAKPAAPSAVFPSPSTPKFRRNDPVKTLQVIAHEAVATIAANGKGEAIAWSSFAENIRGLAESALPRSKKGGSK